MAAGECGSPSTPALAAPDAAAAPAGAAQRGQGSAVAAAAARGAERQEGGSAPQPDELQQVVFNVSGERFTIPLSAVAEQPDTMLGAQVSHLWSGKDGPRDEIFVNRDPDLFKYIEEWYRTGRVHLRPDTSFLELMQEAEYFGLPLKRSEVTLRHPVAAALGAVGAVRETIEQYQDRAEHFLAEGAAYALFAAALGDFVDAEEDHVGYQLGTLEKRYRRLVRTPKESSEHDDETDDDSIHGIGCQQAMDHAAFATLTRELAHEQGLEVVGDHVSSEAYAFKVPGAATEVAV
eukprot:TRINITY_DN22764_c0_g1_i1.p1 TRINITY_DN22764_c0_g1~~TRINITY_DN22764_c0_g1_i1.p1  ORF type:complete len:291 (+),score=74.00 TRINITY_DN22764_c0_g1_i1:66-938(+)